MCAECDDDGGDDDGNDGDDDDDALQGPLYRALYDYDAQDDDEVSFLENDIICNVQPVDDGWVLGVVQKNNLKGMIPSNYIGEME